MPSYTVPMSSDDVFTLRTRNTFGFHKTPTHFGSDTTPGDPSIYFSVTSPAQVDYMESMVVSWLVVSADHIQHIYTDSSTFSITTFIGIFVGA